MVVVLFVAPVRGPDNAMVFAGLCGHPISASNIVVELCAVVGIHRNYGDQDQSTFI